VPHVLIRVKEWSEWLPVELQSIGFFPNPQNGQPMERKLPMQNGVTGFELTPDETLLEINIQATDSFNECTIFKDDDLTSDKETQLYGLYRFQAVIQKTTSDKDVKAQIDRQKKFMRDAEAQQERIGRDRRGDLVVIEHGKQRPNQG